MVTWKTHDRNQNRKRPMILFVATLLVLAVERSESRAAMWSKPLNSTLFARTSQLYRDCRPGFLCINLGDKKLHKEKQEENEVVDKMEEFFKPASLIVPQRSGRDSDQFVCETHTVLLRGRCWVLCDSIKLWPCGEPLFKMSAPQSVQNTWRQAG